MATFAMGRGSVRTTQKDVFAQGHDIQLLQPRLSRAKVTRFDVLSFEPETTGLGLRAIYREDIHSKCSKVHKTRRTERANLQQHRRSRIVPLRAGADIVLKDVIVT